MSQRLRLWPFSPSQAQIDARRLVEMVSQVSRQPGFFGEDRVADTLQGRLEMLILNASVAFIRLRRDPELAPLAQAFADALFRHFDAGLREDGVGDLAVPKRMRKIASDFYGRLEVYAAALTVDDRAAAAAAIARNVLRPEAGAFAEPLAAYAADTVAGQASQPVDALFRLDGWALPPA